eukprot:766832-Hanusia_phi.AAC.2
MQWYTATGAVTRCRQVCARNRDHTPICSLWYKSQLQETQTRKESQRDEVELEEELYGSDREIDRDLQVGIDVVKAYSIIHLRSVISFELSKITLGCSLSLTDCQLRKYIQKIKSATVLKHFTILGMFGDLVSLGDPFTDP